MQFKFLIWSGLRAKIIAWTFLPTMIILSLVAIWASFSSQSIAQELILERDKAVVNASAQELSNRLAAYAEFLLALARTPDFYDGTADLQEASLEQAANRLSIFDGGVVVLNTSGRVAAIEPERPITGADWSNRSYFRYFASPKTGGVPTAPYFSEILQDGPNGGQVVAVAVPVIGPGGEFRGVLAGMFQIGPNSLTVLYGDIIKLKIGVRGSAYLVDQSGKVIYHSDPQQIGQDYSGKEAVRALLNQKNSNAIRSKGQDGADIAAGFAPLSGADWGLVVEESWASLTAANRAYLWSLTALLMLGMIIPMVVVHFSSKQIVRPLNELRHAATELAHGNFDRTILTHTDDEIADLASQFNIMAGELRDMYANLEEKVAERTAELSRLNTELALLGEELRKSKEKADAANQSKSVFLANMSHELRTPLNAILGFAQLMSRDPDLLPRQRENLETIGRSGEHLLSLINDVLEMSKIEAGRTTLNLTGFNLYRLLSILESMFRLRALEKNLQLNFEIHPDTPHLIRADEGKVRQVLINLLSNAVKFTQQGGVTLRLRHRVDSQSIPPIVLDFEVEDTGPGIASDEIQQLFNPFSQTTLGQKSNEGTGLGLAISYQFVSLMGGNLKVKSDAGRGSLFSFSIPVALANPDDIEQSIEPSVARRVTGLAPGQPNFRILVVEDKEPNRRLMIKLLSTVGFEVEQAANGQEAIEIWKAWKPHLIWMDMRMPVMDGHEATRRIKATEQGRETVIIALTASAFEEERNLVLSEGCDDFVRKPFREEEVFDCMNKFLGVQYIYEEQSRKSSIPVTETQTRETEQALRNKLQSLNPALRDEINRAASQADSDKILEMIPRLCGDDTHLAKTISEYVHNFRFDVLMSITRSEDEDG